MTIALASPQERAVHRPGLRLEPTKTEPSSPVRDCPLPRWPAAEVIVALRARRLELTEQLEQLEHERARHRGRYGRGLRSNAHETADTEAVQACEGAIAEVDRELDQARQRAATAAADVI